MFQKILVPLDGSDLSEGILPYVSILASGLEAQLVLLSVVDPGDIEPFMTESILERAQDFLRTRLEESKSELSEPGLNVTTSITRGRAADEILRAAEQEGYDLIAMSTHGRSMLGRGVLGSVTDKVIHSSKIPVLTITPDRAKAYDQDGVSFTKIMTPLDGSSLSESVLQYVEELSRKLSLRISLVRVLRPGGVPASYLQTHPYQGMEQLEADLKSDAAQYMEKVSNSLKEKGLDVEQKLLSGAPAVAILDLAKDEPYDLICIATHGRSGISRWVMGSVAETLVRASNDPVLVIPPPSR